MLTLLSEIHFWTTNEDITIKDNDYGIYKYQDKKDVSYQNVIMEAKRSYSEKRDYIWSVTNKRPIKLKDKLKEFEEHIKEHRIIYNKWIDNSVLRIITNTGLICNLCVNVHTGDVLKISFDKYLIGRLVSESVSDILITRSHILITYNDNQITVIHFNKLLGQNPLEKINKLEPKITTFELAGPPGRKLERSMSSNLTGDIILTSWKCVRDEVYPWSPIVKDQDRANIHIYHIKGSKIELLSFLRTECDPINISFSKIQQHVIHCVEQKVSRKGEVSVDTYTLEIARNQLEQLAITTIPLQTQVCCNSFSPDNEKLLLGCIDGSVVLFDQARGVTHLVKAGFIPSLVRWHVDGALVMIANEKCQMQCFDTSLACTNNQVVSEDITPMAILDLSTNFKNQSSLLRMEWNDKIDVSHFHCSNYLQTDSFLLLIFEKGPLGVLRLFSTWGLKGDVHSSGLTPDNLVYNYISTNQIDRAISILSSLNWEMYGVSCLMSLQRIVNHLFKQKLTREREEQIQRALGSFYSPLQPISNGVVLEFGDQIKDIARKFFHLLIRYRLFEKAFCLAIDINDYDLFMDLYYYAILLKDNEMADASMNKAKELLNTEESSHSTCSRSSCSQCSEDESEDENFRSQDVPPLPVTNKPAFQPSLSSYTPPLPVMKAYIPPFPQIKTVPTPITPIIPNQNHRFVSQMNVMKPRMDVARFIRPDLRKSVLQNTLPVYNNNPRIPPPKLPNINTPLSNINFRHYFPGNSCESLNNNEGFNARVNQNQVGVREIVHRTISFNIPPPPSITSSVKKIGTGVRSVQAPLKLSLPVQSTGTTSSKSSVGEKNVKFSDTVTAFIVPEIQRTEKPKVKRPCGIYITDPKQELADSLPLCSPNEEYLKDFTPISNSEEEETEKTNKIQVVHFGMV